MFINRSRFFLYHSSFIKRTFCSSISTSNISINNNNHKRKSIFRNICEYGLYTSVPMSVYSYSLTKTIDYGTILDISNSTIPLLCTSIYGLSFGITRGLLISIADLLIHDRRLANVISQTLKETRLNAIKLDDISEKELEVIIENIYKKFPWTYEQTLLASIKRSIAFIFLPNVEQIVTGIYKEIEYSKIQKKSVSSFEKLSCGIVNGLVQAQFDKIDMILLNFSWALLVSISGIIFSIVYTTKKGILWFGTKKEKLIERKDEVIEKYSQLKPDINETKEQIKEWYNDKKSNITSSKKDNKTSDIDIKHTINTNIDKDNKDNTNDNDINIKNNISTEKTSKSKQLLNKYQDKLSQIKEKYKKE